MRKSELCKGCALNNSLGWFCFFPAHMFVIPAFHILEAQLAFRPPFPNMCVSLASPTEQCRAVWASQCVIGNESAVHMRKVLCHRSELPIGLASIAWNEHSASWKAWTNTADLGVLQSHLPRLRAPGVVDSLHVVECPTLAVNMTDPGLHGIREGVATEWANPTLCNSLVRWLRVSKIRTLEQKLYRGRTSDVRRLGMTDGQNF